MAGHIDQFAPVIGERVIERQSACPHSRQPIEVFFKLTIEGGEFGLGVGGGWVV